MGQLDHQQSTAKATHRVATDLENLEKSGNLKETPESQGICLKSQGICDRIPKVREFCCLKFILSRLKILILKIYWGNMSPDPPNGLGITVELNLGMENSGKIQGKSGNFILFRKWQLCTQGGRCW